MNVLLVAIDAKYIHTNNAVRLLQVNTSFPTRIIEKTIKDSPNNIINDIKKINADIVGFSVYIWNVEIVKEILLKLKDVSYKIILGGPEVSYDVSEFLHYKCVHSIVRGEGELVFDKLLTKIKNNEDISDLPNIAFMQGDKLIINPIEEIKDLSQIKLPYYRKEDLPHLQNRISYIEASRGCPFKCSYCLSSLEKTVRFFKIDSVKKALSYLVENGAKTIKFLDRTFNANKNSIEIIQHIISLDNRNVTFQFEITGDMLDVSIIEYIHENARKGLFRFEIGIQSTNDETNLLVDRRQNNDRLFKIIKLIRSKDIIDMHLDLIAGLPNEDLVSFKNTFNHVFVLGAKELQLGFLKMLRGTKIRNQAHLFGYEFSDKAPYEIIKNNFLSENDLAKIRLVEDMLEVHHNKGHFGINMHDYLLNQPSPFDELLRFGVHYKINGYKTKGYQIKELYERVFEIVDENTKFLLLEDYLKRSPIKPQRLKIFVPTKEERNQILTYISEKQNIPLNKLYKHSILHILKDKYLCAYYQNQKCLILKDNI